MNAQEKYAELEKVLKNYGKIAVAFSGGVDSSFLLAAAKKILGMKKVLAVTIQSEVTARDEIENSRSFCWNLNIDQKIIKTSVFEIPDFDKNLPDRCYICKKVVFQKIIDAARENGFEIVCDGTNASDSNDYRPGSKAIAELKIESPLKLAGMTKDDIRTLSMQMKLPTWNKPSRACLASRFVYGEKLLVDNLQIVERCEKFLFDMGFAQARVRFHGAEDKIKIARIEVLPLDFKRMLDHREEIVQKFRFEGFNYVTMDLQGFRSDSMNEVLNVDN